MDNGHTHINHEDGLREYTWIEASPDGCPDCVAKRCRGGDEWDDDMVGVSSFASHLVLGERPVKAYATAPWWWREMSWGDEDAIWDWHDDQDRQYVTGLLARDPYRW